MTEEFDIDADITPIGDDEFCEGCKRIFEDGEEYWWTKVEEEDKETDERYCLCDECYRDFVESTGDPYIKEVGGNGD